MPTVDEETTLDLGATTEELALAVLLAAADEATLEGLARAGLDAAENTTLDELA